MPEVKQNCIGLVDMFGNIPSQKRREMNSDRLPLITAQYLSIK